MLTHLIAVRLARLRHQIGDIHQRRLRLREGTAHRGCDQMRQNTGVQTARTENNQIRVQNPVDDLLTDRDVVIISQPPDVADILADLFLAEIFPAVTDADQIHLLLGQRKHGSLYIQKFAHVARCVGQVPLQINQGRENNIADGMIVQRAVLAEAVAQKPHKFVVHVGHGQQDFAHVSDRRNIQFFFQDAGAAAVVADRDHSGDIDGEKLETGQQTGQSGSSAEYNYFFHPVLLRRFFRPLIQIILHLYMF